MSFIQNLFTSRDNNAQGNTFVGQQDRIWWDPDRNAFYYSDGNTAGGIPIGVGGGYGTPGGPANSVQLNSGSNTFSGSNNLVFTGGNLNVTGNVNISGNISPASNVKIGGIKAGPGANISNDGTLTINTAGLSFSFGDFTANAGVLTLVNVDENMTLQTQGNAEIQLVGNVGFYKPDGIPPNISNRYAFFSRDGQATFYIPVSDPAAGAVKIVGSTSGNFTAPLNTGVMLQVTGQNNDASRIYNDSLGGVAAFVGRRLNGTTGSPTPVLNNEELMRLTAVAHNGTAFPTGAGQRITYRALGNQSLTNGGGAIEFWTTPLNSTTIGQVATVDTANGVNATKFTTSGTISATGNITGGNIATVGQVTATGNITGGNLIAIANTNTVNLNVTGISNLNSNANVKITGGSANTYLKTDGIGNLSWVQISPTPVTNVAANANSYTVDFSDNSLILLYQPTGTVNITLTNYTAGKQARVMIRFGATNYNINTGLANAAQSTEGLTTIPISGGGGHNTKANSTVQLLYTCFDNTAGNCYMAATFF